MNVANNTHTRKYAPPNSEGPWMENMVVVLTEGSKKRGPAVGAEPNPAGEDGGVVCEVPRPYVMGPHGGARGGGGSRNDDDEEVVKRRDDSAVQGRAVDGGVDSGLPITTPTYDWW